MSIDGQWTGQAWSVRPGGRQSASLRGGGEAAAWARSGAWCCMSRAHTEGWALHDPTYVRAQTRPAWVDLRSPGHGGGGCHCRMVTGFLRRDGDGWWRG